MQALGWPVVPEVNASRQTSSAAVFALVNSSDAFSIRPSRSPSPQAIRVLIMPFAVTAARSSISRR